MDIDEGEREKGKTADCGRAHFELEHRTVTIIDAPGHKYFVPRMIAGASQADVAILIVSARKGEFETGFMKGGQTREHAILARTAGVQKIIIAVNKMDDPTVAWSKDRYDTITKNVGAFLKGVGFSSSAISCLPLSGVSGDNVRDTMKPDVCSWYSGDSLLQSLDTIKLPAKPSSEHTCMPILDRYKDAGTIVLGKIQSGVIKKGKSYIVSPGNFNVEASDILLETYERDSAGFGDNARVKLKGVDDSMDIRPGSVLHDKALVIPSTNSFVAMVVIMEVPQMISPGYDCIIHLGANEARASVVKIMAELDKKGKAKTVARTFPDGSVRQVPAPVPFIAMGTQGKKFVVHFEVDQQLGMMPFKDYPALGRFCIRDNDTTIGVGIVNKLK